MDAALSMSAIKALFAFPFRDKNWTSKFFTGSLLYFGGFIIPVIPWLPLWGYFARLVRSGIKGEGLNELPEWNRWDQLFIDGLKLLSISFLLSLPAGVMMALGFGSYFGSTFGAIFVDSLAGQQAASPFFMLMIFSMFFMFSALGISTLLFIFAWFLIPVVQAHVVATGRFGSLISIAQWGRVLAANPGGFLLVFFVMFGLWAVQYLVFYLMYITIVLCFLIPIAVAPLAFYAMVISGALAGMAYREGHVRVSTRVEETRLAPEAST
jgi:hypothetical protein